MSFVEKKPVRQPRRGTLLPACIAAVLIVQSLPVAHAAGNAGWVQAVPAAFTQTSEGVLEMFRGEARTLSIPGTIKRIAVGNGRILSASVVDGRLLLLGDGAGVTSLIVWTEKGVALETKVRVAKANVEENAAQLRQVLGNIPGLRVSATGPNIVLSGPVHRDKLPLIKAAIDGLEHVIDTTTIEEGDALKKTVHFKVQIVEISRTAQKKLGIAWDTQIAGPNIGGQGHIATGMASAALSGTGYFLAGISTQLASRINLAVLDGDAYILAAPELNAKSGGVATFLAGGEVPIPRAGALGTIDVQYKPYGIKLDISPVVDSDNVISAKLLTEISQIDPSVSYGGLPGFMTRRTESDVSIRAGETLAISGLVSADASDMASKLPFLGQIPILGRLFRSDDFRAKKSDLVIFVTPLISDPSQPGQEPNAGLMSRASQIDENYRSRYGDPSPLSVIKPDGQRAKAVPVEAAPVEEAGKPAPAPLQAPVEAPAPAPAAPAPAPVPVPAEPAGTSAGIAAIKPRLLDGAMPRSASADEARVTAVRQGQEQPQARSAQRPLLPGGAKRMPQQVDVLGGGAVPMR